MTAPNDRFWAKVFFRDFIKHYRKMTPEQIVADVEKSMDDLENLEDSGTSFGAKMIRASIGRAENYPQASENGKKGGRPRKNPMPEENAEPGQEQPKAQPLSTGKATEARTEPERRPAATQQQPRQQVQPVAQKAAIKKPGQLVWGHFENVLLTQKQHDDFCVHVGNVNEANKIIDSLSCKLEDGSTTSSNHYASLMHWANYRKAKAEEAAETAKARAAANAETFGNVDRRTPYQKNQDELHQLYVLTSEKLKELK